MSRAELERKKTVERRKPSDVAKPGGQAIQSGTEILASYDWPTDVRERVVHAFAKLQAADYRTDGQGRDLVPPGPGL